MAKLVAAKTLLAKHVTRRDRVLLVNPPVEETRYSWIKWNQPLDLLKLGAHLRAESRCAVELLDFMKPDRDGVVSEEFLPQNRRYRPRGNERYPMRLYGQPYDNLREWIYKRRASEPKRLPTQVWITSLCSYWFPSIVEMCRVVRDALPDARVVVLGNYPALMPDHAVTSCDADYVVNKRFELEPRPAAFDLYGPQLPPFLALKLTDPMVAVEEVRWGVQRRVVDYTFFEDDVCRDEGQALAQIVQDTGGLDRHLRFHLICGLFPDRVTRTVAKILAAKTFAALHFEEADLGRQLDADAYNQARGYLSDAGVNFPDDRFSGFVWIGRPRDELATLVERSFEVLDTFGSLILKPYSPVPGGPEHAQYREHLDKLSLVDWSPHFFPLAEANGVTCGEYHDLYRMAAFLNEKVRSRSFDFLQGTLGADLLRSSLKREVWNLAPSPLRIIDQPTGV